MLEIVAKSARFPFKKLSQFRLEFYKMYGRETPCQKQNVENPVETVKFHLKSGRESLLFEHSPPGFQHVEKIDRIYRLYTPQIVENFCPWQSLQRMTAYVIL